MLTMADVFVCLGAWLVYAALWAEEARRPINYTTNLTPTCHEPAKTTMTANVDGDTPLQRQTSVAKSSGENGSRAG